MTGMDKEQEEIKKEWQNYILQVKNLILHTTDEYIAQLEELNNEILKDIPKREVYYDEIEVELIKLAHFIYIIKQHSNKAISDFMIRFEMRNKIKNLLSTNLSKKQKIIIDLISKGYSKKRIADEMNLKPAALRKHFERIGSVLLINPLVETYMNENQVENIANDDSGFYDIFDFIQSFFDGLN